MFLYFLLRRPSRQASSSLAVGMGWANRSRSATWILMTFLPTLRAGRVPSAIALRMVCSETARRSAA
jgi:hypothetical protein